MAKRKSFIGEHTALTVVIIIVVAFSAGFLLARAKYKPQIKDTFNMVMERERTISDLKKALSSQQDAMIKTSEY